MNSKGGFPRSLFVSPPKAISICKTCDSVYDEPVTLECTHSFCRSCLASESQGRHICPTCKESFDTEYVNSMAADKIATMEMRCFTTLNDRSNSQCNWTGTLAEALRHEKTCDYKLVKCQYPDCRAMVRAQDLPHHEKNCQFNGVSCNFCSRLFEPSNIIAHRSQCGMRTVPCTNFCGLQIPYMELDYHCERECAKQPVQCPVSYLGICKDCEGKIPRDEELGHIRLSKAPKEELLSRMFHKVTELTKDNEDVTHKLDECVKENAYISLQNVVYKLAQEHTLLGYDKPGVPFTALASWVNDLDIAHDMETIDLLNAQLRTSTDPAGNKCFVQHVEFEFHHKELVNPTFVFSVASPEKTLTAGGITASVHVERASNDRMVKFYGKVQGYEGEYECATTLLRLGSGKPFQAMSRVHSGNYQFCKLKTSRLVEDGYIDEDDNKLRILVSFMLPLEVIMKSGGQGGAKKQKI
eukprot:gene25599-32071_t